MMDWSSFVNTIGVQEKIDDIRLFLVNNRERKKKLSPIDEFYDENNRLLQLLNDEPYMSGNDMIGALLFVGIISNVENYCRDILSESIKLCPMCRKAVAPKQLSYASAVRYMSSEPERSIFEGESFCSAKEIRKAFKICFNTEIKEQDLLAALLLEYDKLCHIRHAVVHSRRRLAARNAAELGIDVCENSQTVRVGYAQLQQCASVCTTMVQSMNTLIFSIIAKRWAIDWRKLEWWDGENEDRLFDRIWSAFSSEKERDGLKKQGMTKTKCKNAIKKNYHI